MAINVPTNVTMTTIMALSASARSVKPAVTPWPAPASPTLIH